MVRDKKRGWILAGLFLVLAAVFMLCLLYGSSGWINPFNMSEQRALVFRHLRLDRCLGCVLAGSALAVSGAVIQNVLSNPLASPNLLGINAGAGLFCVAAGIWFPYSRFAGLAGSFLGALAISAIVLFLGRRKRASRTTIILCGIALSQICSSAIDLILTFYPDALSGYASFQSGGFSSVSENKLVMAAIVIVPVLLFVLLSSPEMEVLSLGEDAAISVGMNAKRWTLLLLGAAALLAAACVSYCGMLGFVGLVVPGILRKLHWPARSYLVLCMIGGALLVLICDFIGRVVFAPYEVPAGILLAFIGGPFFLYLLFSKGKKHEA